MSFTNEEAVQIKTDIEILKSTTSQLTSSIGEVVDALKENSNTANTLIKKMDEHDLRREYEAKEREGEKEYVRKLDEKIVQVNSRIDTYIDEVKPIIVKAKTSQERTENIRKVIDSTWARLIAMLVIVGIFAAFGFDLSEILK